MISVIPARPPALGVELLGLLRPGKFEYVEEDSEL